MRLPRVSRSAYVRIGTRCNATCVMCDMWQSTPREMPKETITRVLRHTALCGYSEVILTGGEPLLAKDLPWVLSVGGDLGLRMSVITNGSMLNPEGAVDRRLRIFYRYFLSIDSPSPRTHDAIRGVGCMHNIERWLSTRPDGAEIVINTVLSELNRDDILMLPDWMQGRGLSMLNVIRMKHPTLALPEEDATSVLGSLLRECQSRGIRHHVTAILGGASCSEAWDCLRNAFPPACFIRDVCLFVDVDTRTYPCNCSPYGRQQACLGVLLNDSSPLGATLLAAPSDQLPFAFCRERCDLSNRLFNFMSIRQVGDAT